MTLGVRFAVVALAFAPLAACSSGPSAPDDSKYVEDVSAARSALAAMADGDTLRTLLAALRRVLKVTPVNTVALRRQLADTTVERGRYILEQ